MELFRGDSNPARNLVKGKPRSIVLGDPAANGGDYFIRCVGMADYIQTAIAASNEFTLIAVAEEVLPDAGPYPLISNTASPSQATGVATTGASIYLNDAVQGNNLLRLTTQQAANSTGTSVNIASSTNDYNASTSGPQMFTGRCKANGDRIAKIMGTGLVSTPANSALPPMLGQPYRIGSQYTSGAVGIIDIYAAIIFSRALSDAELDAVYAFVKAFYARRSIVI